MTSVSTSLIVAQKLLKVGALLCAGMLVCNFNTLHHQAVDYLGESEEAELSSTSLVEIDYSDIHGQNLKQMRIWQEQGRE